MLAAGFQKVKSNSC